MNLPKTTGPKRRCLYLNVRGVVWKLSERKKKTKPVNHYKASESSVTGITDIWLFFEICQVQNK